MLPVQKKVIQVYQNGSPDKAVEEAIQIAISKYPAAGEGISGKIIWAYPGTRIPWGRWVGVEVTY
jgi:hypothetical protein